MALKTLVYVSGINNLSDARYCAGMGVDMMGFNYNPDDPEFTSLDFFKEIAGWISGVSWVGEFGTANAGTIAQVASEMEPDYIQVEDPSIIRELQLLSIPIILKVDLKAQQIKDDVEMFFSDYKPLVSYFLLNIAENEELNWEFLCHICLNYPIIIGGNLNKNNIHTIIDKSNLSGISLSGGSEIRPGFKDFDELASILEAIEVDDFA